MALLNDTTIPRAVVAGAFEGAVKLGVLPADDPAVGCLTGVLADLGLDGDAAEMFTARREGLFSEAAIIYIRARQAAELSRYRLPPECDAVVGRIVIDGVKFGIKGLPGVR